MYQRYVSVTICLLALISFACCSSLSPRREHILPRSDGLPPLKRFNRSLKAARLELHLGKRDITQALSCDHQLHFVEGKELRTVLPQKAYERLPQIHRRSTSNALLLKSISGQSYPFCLWKKSIIIWKMSPAPSRRSLYGLSRPQQSKPHWRCWMFTKAFILLRLMPLVITTEKGWCTCKFHVWRAVEIGGIGTKES